MTLLSALYWGIFLGLIGISLGRLRDSRRSDETGDKNAVSYTHLTLPTILLV